MARGPLPLALEPRVARAVDLAHALPTASSSETPFGEYGARVSPDGRWLAYGSDEGGTWEVYVATFPDLRGARRVSAEGGNGETWRPGSSDLYYRTRAGGIAFARIGEREGLPDPDSEVLVVPPSSDLQNFDVTPDGERFLVGRRNEDEIRPMLQVIVGWQALLE